MTVIRSLIFMLLQLVITPQNPKTPYDDEELRKLNYIKQMMD